VLAENSLLDGLKLAPKLSGRTLEVFEKINTSLQEAELTINFNASSWFGTENTYDSYGQMYQRYTEYRGGMLFLKPNDANTDAAYRAQVDDRFTLPNPTGKAARLPVRGKGPSLSPGLQSPQRVKEQMAFGTPQAVPMPDGRTGAVSTNAHFNPNTKQVFAALNYGRRPHGSNRFYGDSYLVLKKRIAVNALYFHKDTFFIPGRGTEIQVPWCGLGFILGHADSAMVDEIIKSCYLNHFLGDTFSEQFMLEAHLFTEVKFADSLKEVRLSCASRSTEIANAKKFASKWGVPLSLI